MLAAKLLGHAGDITRFPDRDHFASYTGTAPVEASSGDVRRHRLNRGGNRQLNTALHLIAVCQIRDPSPGQVYYQRKLAQAKTPEEARRSLKRHLANVVYPTWSPTTAAEPPRVDTQRRYQVTPAAGPNRPAGPHIAGQATSHILGQRRNERTPPDGPHPGIDAKKAEAALRISLARRSSRTSRSSPLRRSRSSLVSPGRRPSSVSAPTDPLAQSLG